jgi:hypothetical protein
MSFTRYHSQELVGTSSYNELKETFEKSTDLDFDEYVEIINNPPFESNKRFIIIDRLWYQNENIGHWCCYDQKTKIYYDSFGFVPPIELKGVEKMNIKREQKIDSESCGYYSIKFIYLSLFSPNSLKSNQFINMNQQTDNKLLKQLMDLSVYYS